MHGGSLKFSNTGVQDKMTAVPFPLLLERKMRTPGAPTGTKNTKFGAESAERKRYPLSGSKNDFPHHRLIIKRNEQTRFQSS
jgi:hypothetical protein